MGASVNPCPGSPGRIGVFRALVLGDMLCAVPALRALRAACPGSRISLIGLPWARGWAERLSCVDDFVAFPGYPGLPEIAPDLAALPGFLAQAQASCYDLLLQMHGSGTIVNPLLAACGARRTAGFVVPGGYCADPDSHLPWPDRGHEIERLLALTDHLGMPRRGLGLEFPVSMDDRAELAGIWPGVDDGPYVCVHAGAQLPSRRWPAARFAAVADGLAAQGLRIVLTGTAGEMALVQEVAASMRHAVVDLSGRTSLWTLGALIDRAALLVCNDTGVSHIAAALKTPSVVVSSGADAARWSPLDAARHRVLWAAMSCRPCGHRVCPLARHACAEAIDVPSVSLAAMGLLERFPPLPVADPMPPGQRSAPMAPAL